MFLYVVVLHLPRELKVVAAFDANFSAFERLNNLFTCSISNII